MLLSDILIPEFLVADESLINWSSQVSHITADSRDVKPGSVFFCIKGAKFDAHAFISDAFKLGAVAVVHDGALKEKPVGLTIEVKDVRRALSYAASRFCGDPSQKMTNIAITGTSGKTSVAWILSHSFQSLGRKTFLGGTLGYKLLGEPGAGAAHGIKELTNTSMDPISIHRFLADALKNGAQASVMEATSQGIVQSRMRDVAWNGAIFTNLSRDHLDLHSTMERYEAAKRALFFDDLVSSPKGKKFAIFNFNDAAGKRIGTELRDAQKAICVITFSTFSELGVDYVLCDLKANAEGLSFSLQGKNEEIRIHSPLAGSHNAENIACAALALSQLGYSPQEITDTISKVPPVPGRLEPLHAKGIAVFIDYAHKPDALEKALSFLKPLSKGRLLSVFGCGGDRDKGKRPVMGEISSRLADVTVVTSDNPRTENPDEIIEQIVEGIPKEVRENLYIEPDRAKAIAKAIHSAKPGDIILVAGKGHEPYQEINGVKYPFHDGEVVRKILADLPG